MALDGLRALAGKLVPSFGSTVSEAPRDVDVARVVGTIPSPEEFAGREMQGRPMRFGFDVMGTLLYQPDPKNKPDEWAVNKPLLKSAMLLHHVGHEVVIVTASVIAEAQELLDAALEELVEDPRLMAFDKDKLLNERTLRTIERKGKWLVLNGNPVVDVVWDDKYPGERGNWAPEHRLWLMPQAQENLASFTRQVDENPHQDMEGLLAGMGYEMDPEAEPSGRHLRSV